MRRNFLRGVLSPEQALSYKGFSSWNVTAFRGAATYGTTLLSHDDLRARYSLTKDEAQSRQSRSQDENYVDLMTALEKVEQRLVMWRAGMWDARVPVLLSPSETQQSRAQLSRVKHETMSRLLRRDSRVGDMQTVCNLTNSTEDQVRSSGRKWLQEKVMELRWQGKVEEAKAVKDAWLNLEKDGARDAQLLERLCCAYGMARMGTFESAFSNVIVPKADWEHQRSIEQGKNKGAGRSSFFGNVRGNESSTQNNFPVQLDSSNAFVDLMKITLDLFPNFDLLHNLRGYDVAGGYRPAVGELLQLTLGEKYGKSKSDYLTGYKQTDSRVLFQTPVEKSSPVVLFDNKIDGSGPDFVYLGPQKQISLITIVSPNRYLRSSQLMPKQQMEGLARRFCFVFGVPFEETKGVNQVSLPHDMLDLQAMERLEQALDTPLTESVKKWMPLFAEDKVTRQEIDFVDHLKKYPQDEWVKL